MLQERAPFHLLPQACPEDAPLHPALPGTPAGTRFFDVGLLLKLVAQMNADAFEPPPEDAGPIGHPRQ